MKSIKDVWALSETKSAAEIEEILQDNGCWLDVRFSLKSKDFEKYICEDMRFPGSDTFALVDVAIRDAKPGILKILGATDFNGFGQIVCFELHENGEIQICEDSLKLAEFKQNDRGHHRREVTQISKADLWMDKIEVVDELYKF